MIVEMRHFNVPWEAMRYKGNLVNLIWNANSVFKQDALIMVAYPSKVVQWHETMLYKLATFPYSHWVSHFQQH